MSGGVPDESRELTGTLSSRSRRTALVTCRAETAEQRSDTPVMGEVGEPLSQRPTDWMAAREASLGDEPGEERAFAGNAVAAAWMLRESPTSSMDVSGGDGGGQVHVLQCRWMDGVKLGRDQLDCTSSRQSVLRFVRLCAWTASTRALALEVRMGVIVAAGALTPLPSSSARSHVLPMCDRISECTDWEESLE